MCAQNSENVETVEEAVPGALVTANGMIGFGFAMILIASMLAIFDFKFDEFHGYDLSYISLFILLTAMPILLATLHMTINSDDHR